MREPIASNDAIWLQDSPKNLMVINAVIITDRLDLATLRDAFRTRVLEGPHASTGCAAGSRRRAPRASGSRTPASTSPGTSWPNGARP